MLTSPPGLATEAITQTFPFQRTHPDTLAGDAPWYSHARGKPFGYGLAATHNPAMTWPPGVKQWPVPWMPCDPLPYHGESMYGAHGLVCAIRVLPDPTAGDAALAGGAPLATILSEAASANPSARAWKWFSLL